MFTIPERMHWMSGKRALKHRAVCSQWSEYTTIRITHIIILCLLLVIRSTVIPRFQHLRNRYPLMTVLNSRMNGMRSGRKKIRSIFLMIPRTKTARQEKSISQNSDTQKKKRDFRSSTIPSPMTVKTGNRSFMKVIPEALWMCHSCSLC